MFSYIKSVALDHRTRTRVHSDSNGSSLCALNAEYLLVFIKHKIILMKHMIIVKYGKRVQHSHNVVKLIFIFKHIKNLEYISDNHHFETHTLYKNKFHSK